MGDACAGIEGTHLDDLSFPPLVLSSHDQNLVVLPNGHGAGLQNISFHSLDHFASPILRLLITRRASAPEHGSVMWSVALTVCLPLSSLLKGEDMIFLLIPEGASKCAFLDFLRSDARPVDGQQLSLVHRASRDMGKRWQRRGTMIIGV